MVNKNLRFLTVFILVLVGWQVLIEIGDYKVALLPGPLLVLQTFLQELIGGKLLWAVGYSFFVILKGMAIAIGLAILLVMLKQWNIWGEEVVSFFETTLHPLPGIAILPIVILWAGIGEPAVLLVIIHSMLWPLTLTLNESVLRLKDQYRRLQLAFNFSWARALLHIYLMGSLPALLTGAKIAWSRGWRAFISAEMIFGIAGQNAGLGWYLFEQRVYMNGPKLYAGLLAILACGLIVEKLIFGPLEELNGNP